MSVSCYRTSCNSLLSAVITSSESEFRVRGELRLICLAARPAEYEEVTCRPARGDLMDFAKVQRDGKKLSLMETCHIVFCVLDWLLTIRTRGGAAEERHRRKTRRWDMLWSLPEWKFTSFRLIPVPLMRRACGGALKKLDLDFAQSCSKA